MLKTMGIPVWSAHRELPGEKVVEPVEMNSAIVNAEAPSTQEIATRDARDWKRLQQEVSICTACELQQGRINTVFGAGSDSADLMIIGEAPGQEEERQGTPFIGVAGQLLTQMIEAIELSRETVFITNTLKCRPPDNRDPRPAEIEKCSSFLLQQIQWVKPKVILAVGKVSAQALLNKNDAIGRLREKVYQHPVTGTPIIVTYHPAFLLRQPLEKIKSWNDLVQVKRILMETA